MRPQASATAGASECRAHEPVVALGCGGMRGSETVTSADEGDAKTEQVGRPRYIMRSCVCSETETGIGPGTGSPDWSVACETVTCRRWTASPRQI